MMQQADADAARNGPFFLFVQKMLQEGGECGPAPEKQ